MSHADHLNTPRLVANAAGTSVWRWDQQEPFGNNVPDEDPSGFGKFDLPLRLPGQYYDKETTLAYNFYRDFDSSIGRYAQSDPIGLARLEASVEESIMHRLAIAQQDDSQPASSGLRMER